MKKTTVFLVALFSLAALTSCQKEEKLAPTQFRGTMEACTNRQNKTILNGTALEWVQDDPIAIVSGNRYGVYAAQPESGNPTTATFTNMYGDAGSGPYYAVYPSDIADIQDVGWRVTIHPNGIVLPTVQGSPDGSLYRFPMYAESSNNQLQFKNLCGVLKLHLQKSNTSVKKIAIIVGEYEYVSGAYTVSYNAGNPTLIPAGEQTNSVTLSCTTAQSIDDGRDFYIALPPDTYSGMLINIIADDGSVCSKRANVSITINRSQSTLVTLLENDLNFLSTPTGAINGLFSVGPAAQAWFSQGNLQYNTTGSHRVAAGGNEVGTFRFAEHQYDMIGAANANVSSSYAGWIDLFGWGTSGYNEMYPYMTSTTWTDYPSTLWPDNSGGLLYPYDWGRYNAISNGDNNGNWDKWRTPNSYEWNYLLNIRADALSKRGIARVANVNGLVLLPDHWTQPSAVEFAPGYSPTWDDWTVNNYSASEWQLMETAGAVFLPAAGYRNGTNWYGINGYTCGYYWSSSRSTQGNVVCVEFTSQGLSANHDATSGGAGGYGGMFAQAVRLIQYVHN